MSKANHYLLTPEKFEELLTTLRTDKRVDVVRRAQPLLQLHKGERIAAVEESSGVKRIALWRWHHKFLAQGADGLHDEPKSGRPRKTSTAYIAALEETMATDPVAAGYTFHIWTSDKLIEHLARQTGIHICERTMETLLAELDYVYRRPKVDTKHLQDPEAVAVASANLETLKKGRVQGNTSFSLWTKQPANPTPTSANAG